MVRAPNFPVRLGLGLLLLAAVAGCAIKVSRRQLHDAPPLPATLDGETPYLKAHFPNGELAIFAGWQVDENAGTVSGRGERFSADRTLLQTDAMTVAIDSVAIFESNVVQNSSVVGGLTVISVLSAGVSVYCLTNPKACFGSCPTFYAPGEDGQPLLQAEGFSASVAPILEDDDLDALSRCRVRGELLEIVMTNEALETHVVRQVDLLVAPRPQDGHVFADSDGICWQTGPRRHSTTARGPEGDIGALLREHDGAERFSLTDADDLAAREQIELVFDEPGAGAQGLLVVSRQALVSTYLFYQGLAYLGREATPTLARARQVLAPSAEGQTFGSLLGRIEVQVLDRDGHWRAVGAVGETGPLAANAHLLPLGEDLPSPLQVRLNLAKGSWRLDQIALLDIREHSPTQRLAPAQVRRDGAADPDALARLRDPQATLVTYPGDRYTLVYELPGDGADLAFFLHSRGYYLEWMRREWLADEDHAQAARLFLTPAAMLRELAPAFKELEPNMEAQFWGSRYAR